MRWLFELHNTQPIAHAVAILSFVCVVGMTIGSAKLRDVGLGTSGVLFAGILVGHFGQPVDHHTLEFVKEFGLILFVFTIGLQLGLGFFAALKQRGLRMNVLAAEIVILGVVSAPLIGWLAGFDPAAVLGIFSGASKNTPSLGAGTQTLSTLPNIAPDRPTLPARAYAGTYPTAIVGSIGTLLLIKQIFRIDLVREAAESEAKSCRRGEPFDALAGTEPDSMRNWANELKRNRIEINWVGPELNRRHTDFQSVAGESQAEKSHTVNDDADDRGQSRGRKDPQNDPELAALIEAWPELPAALKTGITVIVKAAISHGL